jgi:hypothetical protein
VPTFIEFPLGYKQTSFGSLPDPKVPVAVRTRRGWRTYRFLLDTGADFLERFVVTIDTEQGKIILREIP